MSNRGTGAGGINTTKNGKKFEDYTDNEPISINIGYEKIVLNPKNKNDYYLLKIFEDKKIIFTKQNAFKKYMKQIYNIDMVRTPDEAYIIEYNNGKKILKILEKKTQNVSGSVADKILCGVAYKREYELLLPNDFEINYAFCLNKYLKNIIVSDNIKYKVWNIILKESNIPLLFGDDEDYFKTLDRWLNNSL
jgi:hypothetical protein